MGKRMVAAVAVPTTAWAVAHRAAPAVRMWGPGGGTVVRAGPLSVRTIGTGSTVVVLLHGLLSSQAQWGAGYDRLATGATVVIPDLLGFAGSMDESREHFGLDDHLQALDDALDDLGLADRPTIVTGHSLGSLVAIQWSARHQDRVRAVVGWSPPLYRDTAEAVAGIGRLNPLAATLSRDTPVARAACRWNCRHRELAGWLAVTLSPRLPVAVTRAASQHTWEAYRGAFDEIILDDSWATALRTLDTGGTPVRLVTGDHDALLVNGRAAEVAADLETVRHETWSGDHHLPMTHATKAVARLQDVMVSPESPG